MATFDDIRKANEGMSTVPIKGKDYVVVPQRVKAFRQLYPEGFILTDIISHTDGMVVMQAKAGYYTKAGEPVVLGSGLAFENQGSSYINKTSYIENCETSAIGRALGFLGLGIDAQICSAEELINAVTNQNKQDGNAPVQPREAAQAASVTTQRQVPAAAARAAKPAEKPQETKPEPKQETPGAYILRKINEFKGRRADFNFVAARQALIEGRVVDDIPSAVMTMDQAVQLMDAIDRNFLAEAS